MILLEKSGVAVAGANALVIGRSILVGRPVASLLLAANATVTVAHSKSRDLPALCGQRSEEHTSELQSLMRISYAVFCLKKKNKRIRKRRKTGHYSENHTWTNI